LLGLQQVRAMRREEIIRKYHQEIIAAAYPYWEAEAEVVKRFFRRKPGKEEHVFWLRAQLWKELHPVDGYFSGLHRELARLAEMFPQVDREIDRRHFRFLLEQMLQEFSHYLMMADILEYLLGRKISPDDAVQLSEEKKLQQIRKSYSDSCSEIDRAAVLVTEGGGARMFREGRKLRGSPLERKIAQAMDIIYRDERNHFKEAARQAAAILRSRKELERMKKAVREISLQRVYMRNEMFKDPLSEDELRQFIRAHAR